MQPAKAVKPFFIIISRYLWFVIRLFDLFPINRGCIQSLDFAVIAFFHFDYYKNEIDTACRLCSNPQVFERICSIDAKNRLEGTK